MIEKAEEVAAEIAEGKYLPDGQEAFQAALDAAKALTKDDAQATIDAAAQTLTEPWQRSARRRIRANWKLC